VAAVASDHLGVVTRRHGVETKSRRSLEEQVKLDVTVALDTGVRRLTGQMTFDEGSHHVTFELFGVIENV